MEGSGVSGGTTDVLRIAWWLVAAAPLAYYVCRTWGLLRLKLSVGLNDAKLAADAFQALLKDARHTMLICDDGNDMPESIYNNDTIVNATGARLEANPDLRLFCLFCSTDETKFTRRFATNPQVKMKRGVQPRRDIHFKIIDGGRQGYVSSHPLGSSERRYRLYDCSRVPERIRDAALGRHVRDMESNFAEAAGA